MTVFNYVSEDNDFVKKYLYIKFQYMFKKATLKKKRERELSFNFAL